MAEVSKHTVFTKTFRGHRSAVCTCGARWANIKMDGTRQGNGGSLAMVRHVHETEAGLVHGPTC